jgi:hypothetical protein
VESCEAGAAGGSTVRREAGAVHGSKEPDHPLLPLLPLLPAAPSRSVATPLHRRIVTASATLGEHRNPLLLWRLTFEPWTQSSLVCSPDVVPPPHCRDPPSPRRWPLSQAGHSCRCHYRYAMCAPLPFVVARPVASSCCDA